MKLLFVADPLESFKTYKDTTFAMMREAERRGHAISACEPRELRWEGGGQATDRPVSAQVRHIRLTGDEHDWFSESAESGRVALRDFDAVLMRLTDIFLGFPALILALALVAVLGPGPVNVVVALVVVFWTDYARVVRATTLMLREMPYVAAAQTLGASHRWILTREILPNAIGPIIVLATLGFGTAIIAESALSFLGFGVPPPAPSWGWTLAYGSRFLRTAPWLSTMAGLTIMIAVLGFNLLGDGLRDMLDPRELNRDKGGRGKVAPG